jgi:signal transduction histidine kinase
MKDPGAGIRLESFLGHMIRAMTLLLIVGTLVGVALLANQWRIGDLTLRHPLVRSWLIAIFALCGHLVAGACLRAGNRRAAAWYFYLTSLITSAASAQAHPYTASFTYAFMTMMLLASMPHVSRRDLQRMGAISLFVIGVTTSIDVLINGWPALTSMELIVRALIISVVVAGGVLMFRGLNHSLADGERERLAAQAAVEASQEQLQRHNTYLSTLSDISMALMHSQPTQTLLELIATQLSSLVQSEHVHIELLAPDGESLRTVYAMGEFSRVTAVDALSTTRKGEGLSGLVWNKGQLMVVDDYSTWPGRRPDVDHTIKSIASVPLLRDGTVFGTISIAMTDPARKIGAGERDVLNRFAQISSLALDNARLQEAARNAEAVLQQRVEERTSELNRLLAITNNLASSLDMDVLMGTLFDELAHIVPYDSGAIFMATSQDSMTVLHYRGPIHPEFSSVTTWPISHHHAEVFATRRPLFIGNVMGDEPAAVAFRDLGEALKLDRANTHIVSWIGVPIVSKDAVIGLLALDSSQPHAFTEQHAILAWGVAQQAGMAFENARLHTHSVQAAASAERSRLARDLHDSVSQAVFSMALGARTMQELAVIAPERVLEPLPHVISMAEAALTEMRALIFELRPESLQEEGLLAALRKHMASLRARHGLQVIERFCEIEPSIDIALKEALYRISLEAMHNTVKHARAKSMTVRLHDDDVLLLAIEDDGIGFDPSVVPPGHYGLKTMRERVAPYGGSVQIQSQPGAGTRVIASVPKHAQVLARHGAPAQTVPAAEGAVPVMA